MQTDEVSLSAQSVFDWGYAASVASMEDGAGSGPASRYDPKAMSRIVDITDLVDDSDCDDSDEDLPSANMNGGTKSGRNGVSGGIKSSHARGSLAVGSIVRPSASSGTKDQKPFSNCLAVLRSSRCQLLCRQTAILITLLGIIIGASIAIKYAVTIGEDQPPRAEASVVTASPSDQELLEIAERIVMACSEDALNRDMSDCKSLCHSKMCCFESGDYNCANDESKRCAVHAGCEALMEGLTITDDWVDVLDSPDEE